MWPLGWLQSHPCTPPAWQFMALRELSIDGCQARSWRRDRRDSNDVWPIGPMRRRVITCRPTQLGGLSEVRRQDASDAAQMPLAAWHRAAHSGRESDRCLSWNAWRCRELLVEERSADLPFKTLGFRTERAHDGAGEIVPRIVRGFLLQ